MKFCSIFKNLTGISLWLRLPIWGVGMEVQWISCVGTHLKWRWWWWWWCAWVCADSNYFLGQRRICPVLWSSKTYLNRWGTHSSLRREMVEHASVSLHFLTKCSAWTGISLMPLSIPTRTVIQKATGWTKAFVFSLAYINKVSVRWSHWHKFSISWHWIGDKPLPI